jgi:hypothetical protein
MITVKKDEWLSRIVLRRYGKMNDTIMAAVRKVNPHIKDIDYIQEGWTIFLPEMDILLHPPLNPVPLREGKGSLLIPSPSTGSG